MPLTDLFIEGVGTAGNFLSAVERIKAEIHRDTDVDTDDIKRALCSAMEHYRHTRFFFNIAAATMVTSPGDFEYNVESAPGAGDGFPVGISDIDLVSVYLTPLDEGGVLNDTRGPIPLDRTHVDDIRILSGRNSGGRPVRYAFEPRGSQVNRIGLLTLFPTPGANYVIKFDFMADISRPVYQFVGGQWQYFNSRTGASINDDYSTPWLTHAEELIRNRAKADLWANVFYEDSRAQMARGQEKDALAVLELATSKQVTTGEARPYFGGRLYMGYGYGLRR